MVWRVLYGCYTYIQHASSLQKFPHLAFHIHSHIIGSMKSVCFIERSSSLVCRHYDFQIVCVGSSCICRIFLDRLIMIVKLVWSKFVWVLSEEAFYS
jgi:hypothetical protein